MTFKEIVFDYIAHRKTLFNSFLVVCCALYLVKVLLTSHVYSKLFKGDNFEGAIKEICGVWVLLCILYVIKSKIETAFLPDFLSYIRKKLFENYVKNNEVEFNDLNVTEDLHKILEVTRNIRDVFMWIVSTFIPTVVLSSFITIYFLVYYPSIGGVMLLGNIINFYILSKYTPDLIKGSNNRENEYLKMSGILDENFNNLLNIYLNNKTEDTIRENEKIEKEYTRLCELQNQELEKFSARLKGTNYLFAFISMWLLYKKTSDTKNFVNGLLIFTFYLSTLENMAEDIPFSLMTLGNIQNIEEALSRKNKNHVKINPQVNKNNTLKTKTLATFKGEISFKNIYFRYSKDAPWILNDFSLTIPAGDRVSFVSQSGFGKTTIMKLLLGFYPIEKGEILLDGENMNLFPEKDIRSRINYVNQKTLLFHDSIINNMKYGNRKTTEEIIELLKKYDLLKIFCKDGSNCLDKMVEKTGTNMSLGMQKIIFLVRGVLKDNVTVYIFDEPLTSLDPSTRENVLDMIGQETKGKTLIIITHDTEVSRIVNRSVNLKEFNKI